MGDPFQLYSPEIKRWCQRKVKRCGGKTVVALKAVAAVHQRNGLGRTYRD